ncbi:MAG TPA: flagellar filament capping protein FliD [Stellaceae bacterium]
MAGLTGVSSGILSSSDITSLIQQATAANEIPITALQSAEQPLEAQISALGKVQSSLSGLQSALSALANVQTLSQRSTSSTSSGVTATATNQATLGTYTLSGIHLATAETLLSSTFSSASGSLGSGSLTFQVGSGAATTLSIASGQDNLAAIAATINQANLGVSASVIFDGAKYSLTLSSTNTGASSSFTVSGGGALSAFTYNGTTQNLTEQSGAQNATFSLNGVAITSGSNTINGAVKGLSLTLASSGAASVTVAQNTQPLLSSAQSVVQAMNAALTTIGQFSSFSQTSGAGPLLGDVGLQIVRTDLLNAISNPFNSFSASGSPSSLGAIGFSVTSGGQVTLNTATLQSAAQSNYTAVAGLLGAAGIATNSNVGVQAVNGAQPGSYAVNVTANGGGTLTGTIDGQAAIGDNGVLTATGTGPALGLSLAIANGVTGNLGSVTVTSGLFGSLSSILTGALDPATGSVTSEVTNLNASISSMSKQMATLAAEAQAQTQELTQEFSAAQATISQLSTVSSFLTSYFNMTSGGA